MTKGKAQIGARVCLESEGEGWFAGAPQTLTGVVEAQVQDGHGQTWSVVRLDEPLDFQRSGGDMPSRYERVRAAMLALRPRWLGSVLNAQEQISAHVVVVPSGHDPRVLLASVVQPDIWASCRVIEDAA